MKDNVLFNKNHIEVHRYDFTSSEMKGGNPFDIIHFVQCIPYKSLVEDMLDDKGQVTPNYFDHIDRYKTFYPNYVVNHYYIEESPLGFYYINGNDTNDDVYRSIIREHRFVIGSSMYLIAYPREFGDTKLSHETRPWMLLDSGMAEHFINDLFESLKKVHDDIVGATKKKPFPMLDGVGRFSDSIEIKKGAFGNEWRELMIDVFDNAEGPRFQTNDEKVLAAGFDLKTSFRKM